MKIFNAKISKELSIKVEYELVESLFYRHDITAQTNLAKYALEILRISALLVLRGK